MPKFAANLTTLFNEFDFLDRFAEARAHGFEAVELLFPYAWDAGEIAARLGDNQLHLVQFNLAPGDWDAGDRGLAVDPGRQLAFRDSVDLALEYAATLGVKQLHCMAGIAPPGMTQERARSQYVDSLRYATSKTAAHGIRVMVEPINKFDMPGYFLNDADQAATIIAEVGADNLYLQYDIYHMQRMGGQHADLLRRLMPLIRHMQLADVPGRHEPGSGVIDWAALFVLIDRLGYDGYIGCEYFPAAGTAEGLGWRRRFV